MTLDAFGFFRPALSQFLSDGDAQIFHGEITQWNSMQAVALGNKMRVECRLAPVSTF